MLSTAVSFGAYLAVGALARWLCPWVPTLDVGTVASSRLDPGLLNRVTALVAPVAAVLVLWIGFFWVFQLDPFFAKTPLDVCCSPMPRHR